MAQMDRIAARQRWAATLARRKQEERANREFVSRPVILAIQRYEAVRDLPGVACDAARLELEAQLRQTSGPVKHGEWLYRWSPADASVIRMKAVR